MNKQLMKRVLRQVAIILAICATGSAWAATKPLAVWNGDLADGTRNGVTVAGVAGNTISGSSVQVTAQGISFTPSQSLAFPVAAMVGFSNVAYSSQGFRGLIMLNANSKTPKYGVSLSADNYYCGAYNGTLDWRNQSKTWGVVSDNTSTLEAGDDSHYMALIHQNSNPGTRFYLDNMTTPIYNASGLFEGTGDSNNPLTSLVVGGTTASGDYKCYGMNVRYVAIFQTNNPTDMSPWMPTEMTSAANPASGDTLSASDNATLASQGINLPTAGYITIDGAVTVAAVFAQGNSEIRFADANSSLTVSGPVYVAGNNTLTLVPTTLSANGSKTILAASVFGSASNISVTDPTETDAIYWHEIGDKAVSVGRGTLALDYTAAPGGGFASGLGSTWMSSFSCNAPEALRVGPNGSTLQYAYEVKSDKFNPYYGLTGRTLPISFSIYADLSAAGTENYAIMAFGTSANGLILYHSAGSIRVGRFKNSAVDGSVAQITKPSAGYHLYTVSCAADGTIKLYLDDGTVNGSGSMTTKTAFAVGFQVGSTYHGNISWMATGNNIAVSKIFGWEGVLSSANVSTLAATYPATSGEIERDITLNSAGTTLKVYSSSEASEVDALLGVDAGTVTIPANQVVEVTKVRTDPNNANGAAANITVDGTLNVSGSDASVGASAGDASITFAYWLDGEKTGDRTSTITVSSGGEINAPNAYVMMPWATPCQGATFEVSGTAKVKGFYRHSTGGSGTLTLANGGVLEVSEILSSSGDFTRNFRYGTFRVKADAEAGRAINFSAASGNATTLDPDGHTLTMAAAAMTGTGAVTVGGSNGGKVVFSGFTSSYTGTIQFSDANKHMIEVTSWNNFAGSLAGTLTIDDTNKDMLGSIPWNKFTGTLKYEVTSGTLDLSAYDMSACTINVTGTGATVVLRTGQEGTLTVGENSTAELLVTEDEYRYEGYVFVGTVSGTLKYKYTADAGVSYSDVANDAYNGSNLIPYYQLFNVSNGASGGNINTASNWGGGAVPTGRNAAFHVNTDSAEGITINVDKSIGFGDIQVYGSGIVTFSGEETLSCANLYIDSGVTVKLGDSAIAVANGIITGGDAVEILSDADIELDGVTCDSALMVNGKLTAKGNTELSSSENVFGVSSLFTIDAGTTKVNIKKVDTYHGQLLGDVEITATGTFESMTGDIFEYDTTEENQTTWDVRGVLAMGSNRASVGRYNIINLHTGSRVTGAGDGYGVLDWLRNGSDLNVKGNATIEAPIRVRNDGETVNFNIDEGATLTLTGGFVQSNGSVMKTGEGSLRFRNVGMSVPITGSEGTLYLDATTASERTTHEASDISFSGILKIGGATNQAVYFNGDPETQLTGWPELRLECGTEGSQGQLWVGANAKDKKFQVKNLSGWAKVVPWSNATGNHYFVTQQEEDTTFSGNFVDWNGDAIGTGNYKTALTVKGGSSVKSLSLTAANDTTGPLEVQGNGKVIFSGSGSWNNGATTVKENGVIESQRNAQVAGAVTLESGATVSIVKVGGSLVPFTAATVNLPAEGTVYVDLTNSGVTSASGATAIIKGTVNDADYLENLSVVGYDGEGAFSYDDVNNQIVYTPVAMDEWSYGSATWSSASVTDDDTHTVAYYDNISDVTFGAISSSPATITLDGARTPASVTFNGGSETTYVISGSAFNPVGAVTISSGTVKMDADATLSAVTGSGTLEIAAGRTVTLTANTALDGVASLKGTGTLVLPAETAPSTSGLTTLLQNANWQGTVVVSGYDGGTSTALPIANWGNSGSKVKLVGVEGKIASITTVGDVVLDNGSGEFGLKITANPGSHTTIKKVSGSGNLNLSTTGAWKTVIQIKDPSEFTGNVIEPTQSLSGRIYFANARQGSFADAANVGSRSNTNGGLVGIDGDVTVSLVDGAEWTLAQYGLVLDGALELNGAATINGQIAFNVAGANSGVSADAKLVFDDIGSSGSPKFLTVGTVYPQSGKTVKIGFGSSAVLRDGAKLVDWSAGELTSAPAQAFVFEDGNSYKEVSGTYYVLESNTTGLFLREAVAKATTSGSVDSYHATVAAAISAAGSGGTVVILKSTDENITYDKTQVTLARRTTEVTTGTVDPGTEYTATAGSTPDSGVYPYTITNKATTYYWTDADGADHNWSTVGNWAVGSSSGSVATRSPTSIDGVVFGDGASVTIAGASCASMSVAGEVEISGTGDLNIYGNVTDGGSGVLTLSGVCLNNWANESSTGVAITVAPAVSFVSGAGIASHNRGSVTINGATSIGGLFKLWDIATVSFSGGLSVDSGATLQLNQNLDLSRVTTVFNGNFSKTANSSENTTLTLGAVTVSASTTPTVSAGTIVLSGAVSVSGGATFTIPASGVTISGATFNLTAVNAVLVAPESLSVTVGTSVADKLVKHDTVEGNTTYSVADAVATYGVTSYGSIENAIEAADDAGGGTVTLAVDSSEDITLPNGVSFCDGGHSYTGTITTDTANHIYYNTTTVAGVTTYTPLSAEASVTASAVTTYYATFDAAMAAAGANTITLLTDITINVAENDPLTISSPIAGSFGITKTGAGTLVLSATAGCSYAGTTVVNRGVLDFNTMYVGAGAFTVASSATLKTSGGAAFMAGSLSLNGAFEVANSFAQLIQIGTLTASADSAIEYSVNKTIIVNTELNLPDSGTVTIDCSALSLSTTTTLINGCVTSSMMSKLSCSAPSGYVVGVSGTALKAFVPQAKIGDTYYATIMDAITAASDVENTRIELTGNLDSQVNVGGKSITFVENGGIFTGTFVGTGTVTLSSLLNRSLCQNAPDGWEGLMVLPVIENAQDLNLNNYGAEKDDGKWTTVNVTGVNGGYIANETVNPVVELVGNMRLTSCSQSFANTFEVVKGSGDFDLSTATFSDSYVYFLLNDVSGFTGSVKTKTGGVGIVLGGATKPTGTDDLGKIIVNTAATIGAGETWVAPGGVRVSEGIVVTMGADASISGTVTLKLGASVKVPSGTAAPTITTDVPYYTITSTTAAGVTTYTTVKKPGTIFSVW